MVELEFVRTYHAPRQLVWDAWTDPTSLAVWWLPAPTRCRVERLDAAFREQPMSGSPEQRYPGSLVRHFSSMKQ